MLTVWRIVFIDDSPEVWGRYPWDHRHGAVRRSSADQPDMFAV